MTALDSTPRIHLPDFDESFADAVMDHLEEMRDCLPSVSFVVSERHVRRAVMQSGLGTEFDLLVSLIETFVEQSRHGASPQIHAQIAMMSVLPAVPEALALQIAFGRRIGQQHADKIALFREGARARALSVDDYVAELVSAGRIPRDRLVQLFHGKGRLVPSPERIKHGTRLLRQTASVVPEHVRPSILCAIAWLSWAAGKRAIAAAYLAEALRIDEDHILAFGLTTVISQSLPVWCARGQASST